MTLEELNAFFALQTELERLHRLRAELMAAATRKTTRTDGMLHANGISDKTGTFAAELADLDADIDRLTARISAEAVMVEYWISTVREPEIRLIFRLRYLRGLMWKEIAGILGINYSYESVRALAYRYLRNQKKARFKVGAGNTENSR